MVAHDLAVVADSATWRNVVGAYAAGAGSVGGGLSGRLVVIEAGTSLVLLDQEYAPLASHEQYTHLVLNSSSRVGARAARGDGARGALRHTSVPDPAHGVA